MTNQIDDAIDRDDTSDEQESSSDSSPGQSFGKLVAKLDRHANSKKLYESMRVDTKGSDQIYDALASSELSDDTKQQYIKFLIDFYVSKTHRRLEPVGFITGLRNTETYGLNQIDFRSGMRFKDTLEEEFGIRARYQRSEGNPKRIELLFDANES